MANDNSKAAERIKAASRTNLFQRLAARFGFVASAKNDRSGAADISLIQKPTAEQLLSKNTKEEVELIQKLFKNRKMSSTIQDYFKEWLNDTMNTYDNIEEREERLNSLTYMCDNEVFVKAAVNLTASEVAMLSCREAFTVLSEDQEWQDKTNKLLYNAWNYNAPTIYALAWDIFLYGEAFQGKEVSSAGIISINPLKVNEVVERLEFKPSQIADFNAQASAGNRSSGFSVNLTSPRNGGWENTNLNFQWQKGTTYKSRDALLKDYISNLADTSSNEFFTSHLLGYRISSDQMVAPWQVSHFRFNAGVSEFWPYGQPCLLSALAAYKQLQRTMGLDDLRQLLSLPITMYKVKTNGATTGRAFDIVNTVKEEFENVGLMSYSAGMEGPSLCTNIWTSDDLVSIETVKPDVGESGAVDKLNFFQDRVVAATGIPKTYLDPSSEGFQMSGVALQAQFQPFRTMIEQIRNIIMEEVENNIELHYSLRNEEVPDYVLSMNVLNPVASDDLSNKLQLADSILEALAGLLNVEDKTQLPKTIKIDVLTKYANLSKAELDKYVQVMDEEGAEEGVGEGEGGDEGMDDFGGGDESGGDEGMEESFKKTKKRLLEARYRAYHPTDIKLYLTEKFGSLTCKDSTNIFVTGHHGDKFTEEVSSFLRSKKLRKQRLDD